MAQCLLLITHLEQFLVAVHEVVDDHHVLHGELPVAVLLLTRQALALAVEGRHVGAGRNDAVLIVVVALVHLAVLVDPLHGTVELLVVVDAEVHAAQNLHQVDILRAHAEVVLEEVGVDDAAGDAHAGVAQREVALAAHRGHGLSGACKAQQLLGYIIGNGVVGGVLHVVAVDAEGGQPLLCVRGEHGSQVDGSRALRAVEAPYGLGVVGIHVHGLRAVAPAGSHGDGGAHALALKLLGAGGALGHAPYRGVGDDTLHGTAVAIRRHFADDSK